MRLRCAGNLGIRAALALLTSQEAKRPATGRHLSLVEASFPMNQSDERTGLVPQHTPAVMDYGDEEEPPGKPRRHPLWRDVPPHHWDDWRWQSQNAIRSVRQLRDLLPFTPEELEAI